MKDNTNTVLVEPYRKAAADTTISLNSYKGLRIHALPGLHDFIGEQVGHYFQSEGKLLDIASGSGALSLRMQDAGFDVWSTDYVSENFKLDTENFIQADLNEVFTPLFPENFQAIIASEIIEHLENPRHFARQCFKLLASGGKMLLTTPNIENAGSKTAFIRSGSFLWFNEEDYINQGHITPLTQWQIKKSFEEAGFKFIWTGSFGEGATRLGGSPRLTLLAKLIAMLSTTDPELSREIFVAVVEKPV